VQALGFYSSTDFMFQANETVQKSITNNIRYTVDKEDRYVYQQELG
jgi:hypothetical protein